MEDVGAAAEGSEPAAYVHDPELVPVLARLVDRACEGVEDVPLVHVRVRRLGAELPVPLALVVVQELAFTFMYLWEVSSTDAPQPGATLVPLEGRSVPPALKDADDQVRALWLDLAPAVRHPIARARCFDIVFTLGLAPNGRDSAERAARAYLESVGGSLRPRDQAIGLLRGWTLTRMVGLSDLEDDLAAAMLALADGVVDRGDDPHAALPLLDALTAPGRKKVVPPLGDRANAVLDRALTVYPQAQVIAEIAAVVRKRSPADQDRADRASRAEVTALLGEADRARDAFAMRYFLSDAASVAKRYGIDDLEQLAVSRLQAAPAVQWQTLQTEAQLPHFLVYAYMYDYRHAADWREALNSWVHTDAPSGKAEANNERARQSFQTSVVRRLATNVVFNQNDLPERTFSGDDSALAREVVRLEQIGNGVYGHLLASGLNLIRARFGIPSLEELTEFLASTGTKPALARALAQAFRLFWVGEFEASAHLAAPKVEAAVRALLLELNEPVYRVSVGDSLGQFPGLGALLPGLVDQGFDPDWERFLRALLLSDGDNMRNLIAHGFMDEVDPAKAALVLRALAVVVLITADEAAQRDSAAVRAALAHPVLARRRSWLRRAADAVRAAYLAWRQ